MKRREGFVTNSSSTSYIITNTSKEPKTLSDFVRENPHLIVQFVEEYDYHKGDPRYTQEELLKSAEENDRVFEPGEKRECQFGDEDGTLIGQVFDYILRDGGKSKSFKWRYHESLR
jgi:hypothetical protein